MQATPVVTVETLIRKATRIVEHESLPQPLFLAIANLELAGTAVFSERGLGIAARKSVGTGPYRGTSLRVSEEVDAVIDALLSEEAAAPAFRVHDRTLEVREVVLYEADLDNGRTAYVCGDPARILPEGVLDRPAGLLGRLGRMLRGRD